MIELNALAKEIYENAEAHGFWEPGPDFDTSIALIHSEWSEALEEYRTGRPMVWHQCINWEMPRDESAHCVDAGRQSVECIGRECCKPEGIAVELIDGVLRIFDFCGRHGLNLDEALKEDGAYMYKDANYMRAISLPHLVTDLHQFTSFARNALHVTREMCRMIIIVFTWLRDRGVDPEDVLREKHAYNKTRPYRHGGKIC